MARGDLDAKVEERFSQRPDEIGTLARDFNHMAAELKAQIQAKEVLLRDISHELRSPLGRIQVALGLAVLDRENVEVQHRRIERDIERMNRLIEEIIRLARLTSAPQSFPMESVDFGLLLDEVADDARPEAAAHGRRLLISRPSNLVLRGNAELLRQAVENVVRNAIRYAPENSEVSVSARRESNNIAIEIQDRGPGVPETDLQRIFDPFYRVSRARDREGGGTGLGLAITARVVALHAGELFAKNGSHGGLVVTIRLPSIVTHLSEIAVPPEAVPEPVSAL